MNKKIIAKSYIQNIAPYVPGMSKTDNGHKVIKLSSNENALGTSPKAIEAYKSHADKIFRYADGDCAELRQAIGMKHNIDANKIVCGAGSDEIIAFLIQAFVGEAEEVLYSEYGFLMYPISTKKVGGEPIIAKEIDLATSIDNIVAKISPKTKIIFIANPNNPTGSYMNKAKMEKLIEAVPKDIVIVLDLAYAEFTDLEDYPNGIELVNKYENVVMIRTFSKIYGLASLRLGWSYSCAYVADILNRVRGPFNVGGASQAAGIAAIQDDEFIEASKAHNIKWLKIVGEELRKLDIKTYSSIANFILIDFLSEKECQRVNDYMLSNGVILRAMTSYKLPNCLRMTIGTEEENLRVIELFSNVSRET